MTLRGHTGEITELQVNFENTLLASGSTDKTIRIWSLSTTHIVALLDSHTLMVTQLAFSPRVEPGGPRWLASTSRDGTVCFWQYNATTFRFPTRPKKFIERSKPGAFQLCCAFSPGGNFLATGMRLSYIFFNVFILLPRLNSVSPHFKCNKYLKYDF